MMDLNPTLDLFPLLAGTLAALTCGLLGNFLVLRRLSLMGDAISHSVLPGLVIAFLVTSTRSPLVMLGGAAAAGLATVVLVELIRGLGRVEPGAAMGVVFSVLFALGVLLIEAAAARHVDLDADCVLHGQLETLVWYGGPETWSGVFDAATLEALPRQVVLLGLMFVATTAFIALLYKELRLAAFDPELATTLGFDARVLHYLLMIFVAAATVASFEAVGSILVIAMLVAPASTARLLTNRLAPQILISAIAAVLAGVGGYVAATMIPAAFDADPVNAAGTMTVASGVLLVLAAVLSPNHGVLAGVRRRMRIRRAIALDDLLAALFRLDERGHPDPPRSEVLGLVGSRGFRAALRTARRRDLVGLERATSVDPSRLRLTPIGRRFARLVVRRHRLWESYLVDRAGLAADHVHDVAERLEHLAVHPVTGPGVDPHGRAVPAGSSIDEEREGA